MEQELDSLLYWETIVTKMGGPLRTMELFLNDIDRKEMMDEFVTDAEKMHTFETEVLIPFLKRKATEYESTTKAVMGEAEYEFKLGERLLSKDKKEGLDWLQRAADQKHVGAQVALGNYFRDQVNPYLALVYYRLAAQQDDMASMENIAQLVYDLFCPSDAEKEEALRWSKRGHLLGDSGCSYLYGLWLLQNEKKEEAFSVFTDLVHRPNLNCPALCSNLKEIYEVEFKNLDTDKTWYAKAAAALGIKEES